MIGLAVLKAVEGGVTRLDVDAIVSAANRSLLAEAKTVFDAALEDSP